MTDCFRTPALAFNLAERYQCPVIILADLLMCEDNETVDPALLDVEFTIDRGELITEANAQLGSEPYLRYKNTASGISPRAIPGLPPAEPSRPGSRAGIRRVGPTAAWRGRRTTAETD